MLLEDKWLLIGILKHFDIPSYYKPHSMSGERVNGRGGEEI